MRPNEAERLHIAHEQLRMVLLHTRGGALASTVFAALLALYVHGGVSDVQARMWLGAKVAVSLLRVVGAYGVHRIDRGRPDQVARWQRAALALLLLDGLVWGVAGVRMAAENVTVSTLMAAALAAVSSVATFGLQVHPAASAAYVLPMLLPTALAFIARGDDSGALAGAGLLLLTILLLSTSWAASRRLIAGILLRQRADALAAEKGAALKLAHDRSLERDRFLAKVSHELRTPLHGMLGLARLMANQSRDPQQLAHLSLLEGSGRHLLGLIDDLLDVGRIRAGRFPLHSETFDLQALAAETAAMFRLRAADKGLDFEWVSRLEPGCWVRGDPARLRQVLHNLLGNAVKFTDQGRVGLSVEADERDAERMRLVVWDSGPGIPLADQPDIFQPFQQVPGAAPHDGVGLGLPIAREIAQAMGGDIHLRSQPGQGSTFLVTVHLPRASAPDEGAAQARRDGLPDLVLVAEDDAVNTMIVQAFLEGMRVDCECVEDGRAAVERATHPGRRPQMVLMDCRMPVMDGLAAAAEIRRREQAQGARRLPILALTATLTEADRLACLAAGMDEVIGKPFTPEVLAEAMRSVYRPVVVN